MAEERLLVFENRCEFEEVLTTYNNQMAQLEAINDKLVAELKKLNFELPPPQANDHRSKSEKMLEYNYKKL